MLQKAADGSARISEGWGGSDVTDEHHGQDDHRHGGRQGNPPVMGAPGGARRRDCPAKAPAHKPHGAREPHHEQTPDRANPEPDGREELDVPTAHTGTMTSASRQAGSRQHDDKNDETASHSREQRHDVKMVRGGSDGTERTGRGHGDRAPVWHDPAAKVGSRGNPQSGCEHAEARNRQQDSRDAHAPSLRVRGIVAVPHARRF